MTQEIDPQLIEEVLANDGLARLPWDALNRRQKRDVVRGKRREVRLAYGFGKVNR